jgi:hypothetical protein
MFDMDTKIDTAVNLIARNVLGLNTLETRNMGIFDFHDLAVWNIKLALEEAYKMGAKDAQDLHIN